jgi:hypothetical protein
VAGERVVFTEENSPQTYVKLASTARINLRLSAKVRIRNANAVPFSST